MRATTIMATAITLTFFMATTQKANANTFRSGGDSPVRYYRTIIKPKNQVSVFLCRKEIMDYAVNLKNRAKTV